MKLPLLLLGLVLASILPRPWDHEKFGGPDGALTHKLSDMRWFVLSEKEYLDHVVSNRLVLIAGEPPAIAARYDATPDGLASLNSDLAARLATNDCQLRLFQSGSISQDSLPLSNLRPATNSAFAGVDSLKPGDVIACCPPDLRQARTNGMEPGVKYDVLKYQLRDLRLAVAGEYELSSYIASNRVAFFDWGSGRLPRLYQCNRTAIDQLKKDMTFAFSMRPGKQWRLVRANRIIQFGLERDQRDRRQDAFLAEIDLVEPGDLVINCQRD